MQINYVNQYSKAIADFCNYIEENSSKLPNIDARLRQFFYEIDSLNSVYPKPNSVGKIMSINYIYEMPTGEARYVVNFTIPFDIYNKLEHQLQMIGYIYDNDEYDILNMRAAAPAAG
jgi:hypothetical protein